MAAEAPRGVTRKLNGLASPGRGFAATRRRLLMTGASLILGAQAAAAATPAVPSE